MKRKDYKQIAYILHASKHINNINEFINNIIELLYRYNENFDKNKFNKYMEQLEQENK